MGSFRNPKGHHDEAATADDPLEQIADLLGVSVETFMDEEKSVAGLEEAAELFAIWNELELREDREQFLAFGRSLLKLR